MTNQKQRPLCSEPKKDRAKINQTPRRRRLQRTVLIIITSKPGEQNSVLKRMKEK